MAKKSDKPDLVVSIGTLGRDYGMLERCLRSIYDDETPNLKYQVWVVFNGAIDDGFTARITKNFPAVTLIARKGPLGYCETHNLVLQRCAGRYILVLDDDTVVHQGTLSKMIAFMDAHQDVGIAGCKTLNPDGTFQKSYGLLPGLQSVFMNAFTPSGFWPDWLYKDASRVMEVEWLNGSFMLVRSEVLQRVGHLDEYYYTYMCEQDWCYRIHLAGWKVVYVPHAVITHVGGQHSINTYFKKDAEIIRGHVNLFYFFYKHYGGTKLLLLRPLMILGALTRIGYFAPRYLLQRSSRELAAERIKGFGKVVRISLSRTPYRLPEMSSKVRT